MFGLAPASEISERALGGKLVIFREAALHGEKSDERADRLLHREQDQTFESVRNRGIAFRGDERDQARLRGY